MIKHHEGDSGLSSFDVKNESLIEALNNFKTSTGVQRDRLARALVGRFIEFIKQTEQLDLSGLGVHPELREIIANAIQSYAAGGSFDLELGGQVNRVKTGRPNKTLRNHAIRLSIAKNIHDGSDVLAAATLTSEQLAVGDVDGLPVVTLTPSAVRSIWYAAPLALLDADDLKIEPNQKNPLIEALNFQELKQICADLDKSYVSFPPTVLKVILKLAGVSLNKIAKFQNALNLIAKGSEPNDAFKYPRD